MLVGGADLIGVGIPDHGEHGCGLLAAHHRDAGVWPHPQLPGPVRSTAHGVVAGAERPAGDDRELRHLGARDRGHELGAVAGDATLLRVLADHEAGDVLEEDKRDAALARQFDEVCSLLGRFGEEDATVREDPDGVALDPGKPADEGVAVERLELVEAAAVDDPGDDLERVELVPVMLGHDPVEVGGVDQGRLGRRDLPGGWGGVAEVADDLAGERERVVVRDGEVIRDTGAARVEGCASELLGRDVFSGGGFHEGRAADEDGAGALDDHRLVAHRGDVGAPGRTRAHDDGDLRDVLRGESCLVEEDSPEVVAVGEDVGLERQKRPARIHQVDAREVILLRDFLGAEVLFDRQREVRASLDGGVVRDDDAAAALDHADAGHDPGCGRLAVVDVPGGEGIQLEECSAGIDEQVDALAGGELATRAVALGSLLAAAAGDECRPLAQLNEQAFHVGLPRSERLRSTIGRARQLRHGSGDLRGGRAENGDHG